MKYCVGFLFDSKKEQVLLIRKEKGPECIRGSLNGLGGKIEEGELSLKSIEREFKEESGLFISQHKWIYVCRLKKGEDEIDIYAYADDCIFNYRQIEEEQVGIYNIDFALDQLKCVYNLSWIINMCLSSLQPIKGVSPTYFIVEEVIDSQF